VLKLFKGMFASASEQKMQSYLKIEFKNPADAEAAYWSWKHDRKASHIER
jgi:hypothetical protein